VLTVSLLLGIAGNILFCYAWAGGIYALLASRAIIGFSTGMELCSAMNTLGLLHSPHAATLGVARAHIAAQTATEERTQFMGYAGAVQFIGSALMPGANIFFGGIDVCAIPFIMLVCGGCGLESLTCPRFRDVWGLNLNQLTAPGFVIAVLNIIALVLDFALFSSYFAPTPADDRATIVVPHNGNDKHEPVRRPSQHVRCLYLEPPD